jgi:hypothetical protein
MFDLEHTHIAKLTDEDLRKLVGKLCEVEARAVGQPVSTVTYGGDQRAADGGVDVSVGLPERWVPRAKTEFQVKQEKKSFTASKITDEMKPEGVLRSFFAELAAESGAYVIVSGGDNPSKSALKERVAAMRAAVADLPDNDKLHLDFYGGDRLAQWVNRHPGVALWVRQQIRQPLSGWKPFGDWSAYPLPTEAEYLPDDGRIIDGTDPQKGPMPIIDGIERMRAVLAQPGKAARLVGLSGMGKTRLAQALFDDRIGTGALDPRDAVYTDIGDEPSPAPRDMLIRSAHDGKTAVLIVDNCPPELHAQLVKELRGISAAQLSLLTIEYDVGDEDQKKETQAFSLEPASDTVIEKIIVRHHPHISRPNAGRIVEVAGGNARLALALAEGVNKRDNVARLSDRELFERLFRQRNAVDDGLLRAAEAAALVYSFDGETLNGETAELPLLTELVNQTSGDFYRHIAELQRRKLVQQRGRWRAVMPQALALHLARRALENIPVAMLRQVMEERALARLLKSFSRRLGYQHDSPQAQQIAAAWLAPGGLLSDVAAMETWDEAWAMFENIAPVCPNLTLAAIQRAADTAGDEAVFIAGHKGDKICALLVKLAYDPLLFDQAVWLLARARIVQPKDDKQHSGQEYLSRLFQIVGSGTHAPQAQRMAMIDRLLNTTEAKFHPLGIAALGGMLRAPDNWLSEEDTSFGARKRDFGRRPADEEEACEWFQTALNRVVGLANGAGPHRSAVRRMLATSLQGLWGFHSFRQNVAEAVRAVAANEYWPEGWAAVAHMERYWKKAAAEEDQDVLQALERDLRPVGLKEKIAQRLRLQSWKIHRRSSEAFEATMSEARDLGEVLAAEPELLRDLAPALMTSDSDNTWRIGQGLADGAADLPALWDQLTAAMAGVEREKRQFGVLSGFLNAGQARDPAWTASALDAAVDDDVLGEVFPYLQIGVGVDDTSVERLHRALVGARPSIWQFSPLAYPGSLNDVSTPNLLGLLRAVAEKPGGQDVCVFILALQFHGLASAPDPGREATLVAYGRELLSEYRLPENVDHYRTHNFEEIIEKCLISPEAENAARSLTANLRGNRRDYQSQLETQRLVCALMKVQPAAVLDVLEEGGEKLLRSDSAHEPAPLKQVDRERLFAWADVNPEQRYPWLAGIVRLYPKNGAANDVSLALALLDRAPDQACLMNIYDERWDVHSWSGSKAAILEARRALLEPLLNHADPAVRVWAEGLRNRIAAAAQEREWERERKAVEDRELQSFE